MITINQNNFDFEKDARGKFLEFLDALYKSHPTTQESSSKMRFEEVTNLWLEHYKKQVLITTYTNRKNLIQNHIFPYFKDCKIDQITISMCQEAINDWYSSFTESARLANLVSTIFKFGINQGFCSENPMTKTLRPKNTHKKNHETAFFEKEELQKFLTAVQTDEPLIAYTMFHTLAYTGLRRGELLSLQWQDIDFDTKTLAVERNLIYNEELKQFEFSEPKTHNSKRKIGIDDATIKILLQWRDYQRDFFLSKDIDTKLPDQLVFTSKNNYYIMETYLRRIVKRITEKYKLPHITIHGFRHTHCSLLFEAGAEMHNVKNRLGHGDIETTINIYNHVTKKERSSTADLFNDFMQDDAD